jgi:urea transporter
VGSAPISRAKERKAISARLYQCLMDTLLKADIFFFVSTIAVVLVTIAIVIVSVYAIKALEQARSALKEVEEHVGDTTEDVKDMLFDLRESTIFRLLFRKRKKNKRKQ